ncbi:MAG: hypothetical protein ACM336_14115 [Acidobacteriota bacterium]
MLLRAYITLVSLTCLFPLYGQNWDALRGLKAGDAVKVFETDGRQHKGTFRAVSSDAISLETQRSEMSIERSRVGRVQIRSASRRLRNALIGAGIGVATGLTVDQTLGVRIRNESNESGGARAVTYMAPIGLFAAIGGARPAYRTVYEAR